MANQQSSQRVSSKRDQLERKPQGRLGMSRGTARGACKRTLASWEDVYWKGTSWKVTIINQF